MNNAEIKALVSLLEDDDESVVAEIEEKIMSIGTGIIPFLEEEWETNFNPTIQTRIEDLIHVLQFELVQERFLDWKENEQDNLLKGLWIIATYQYPDLEYDQLRADFEQLYIDAWREFRDDMTPFDQIKILNSVLFDGFKFRANTKNFHSPANSMINAVLESKKGNPISLSAIYLMIAKRLDLPVYGVNLPNLFILTYKNDSTQFYINVFNKGLIFLTEDIDNYLDNLQIERRDIFYQPCSNLDMILRMLRNLIVSFEKLGDYHKSDEIKIILQKLDPNYFSAE
ncbi:MAG: transglutaminase-like domain-containing protein [Cyclobacteriaceae bacterium]